MFDRLKRIITGAAEKSLEKMETPEVLAQRAQEELESNLKQLREGYTNSVTQEKMLEKQIKTNAEQLAVWEKRAGVAVQANNDDIARQCLMKKKEAMEQDSELNAQLQQAKAISADLKKKVAETEQKLREFQLKKSTLISQGKSAEAVANTQALMSKGSTASGSMAHWEEKVRQKEAEAEARAQIAGEQNFKDPFADSSVDDELAMLKQLQGAKESPILIEDKSSDKDR